MIVTGRAKPYGPVAPYGMDRSILRDGADLHAIYESPPDGTTWVGASPPDRLAETRHMGREPRWTHGG